MVHKQPSRVLLKKLYLACTQENIYSIPEVLAQLGISQEDVTGQLTSSSLFAEVLMACHQSCFAKIETALYLDVLPMKDALKYAKANDTLCSIKPG